jgi:hypothetical protein
MSTFDNHENNDLSGSTNKTTIGSCKNTKHFKNNIPSVNLKQPNIKQFNIDTDTDHIHLNPLHIDQIISNKTEEHISYQVDNNLFKNDSSELFDPSYDDMSENNDDTSENNDDTSENNDDTSENNDDTSENNDDTSEKDSVDESGKKTFSIISNSLIMNSKVGPREVGSSCRPLTSGQKWIAAFLLGLIFGIVSSPFAYYLTSSVTTFLGGLALHETGYPNYVGLLIHSILFTVIVRIILW